MAHFIEVELLNKTKRLVNVDCLREIVASNTIGCTVLVFQRAMPAPHIETMEIRGTYTEWATRLCPPSMKLIQ